MWSQLRSVLLSGGMLLLPTQGVVDHVQPLIPPPTAAPLEKGVPGYACGHPRTGYEYSKMEGVGRLPGDIISGGWMCSDGCGPEVECAMAIKYIQPEKQLVSEFRYVYRKRRN